MPIGDLGSRPIVLIWSISVSDMNWGWRSYYEVIQV